MTIVPSRDGGPAMSVVIVTPDRFDAIRETIDRLGEQTVCQDLEVVVVAPSAERLLADERSLLPFHSWRVVALGTSPSPGNGMTAGARQATGPIIAFAEEHAFPEPEWAAALIRAHDGPWAVVGPAILNANPETRTASADYLLTHGRFGLPASAGEAAELPAHNSSYKRDVLLGQGDELEPAMTAEALIWRDLRAAGHRLYFEPAARVSHLSVASFQAWIPSRFHQSRLFGATRCRHWPWWRRLVYVGGAPLIPPLRFWRLMRSLPPRTAGQNLRALPLVAVGLLVECAGEVGGYLSGEGRPERLSRYELHRREFAGSRSRQREPEAPDPSRASRSPPPCW